MCEAFAHRSAGLPGVRVVRGRFEDLEPHDCFVTAGNAFGLMTAGVDAAVIGRFGPRLMGRVQHRILDEYHGEQPVGTAFVIDTGDATLPFLAHAPTMRVPGSIAGTDKVYASTWAALLAVQAHNQASERKIETVGCLPWARASAACPLPKPPVKWPRRTATTSTPRTGSTGTSSSTATRPSVTTATGRWRGSDCTLVHGMRRRWRLSR
jgi:O-acetyl-ADP-ribose deacetylase (regulator of RNase III)